MEALGPNPAGSPQFPLLSERDTPEMSRSRPLRKFKYVSPDYFRTSGTRLVAGRDYTWSDLDALRPVAIVSRNLAVELWGSPDAAIGQRVRPEPDAAWRQVIGVADDVRDDGAHRAPPAIAYWPSRMEAVNAAVAAQVSRGVGVSSCGARAPVIRRSSTRSGSAISSINAGIPITTVRTMQEIYDASMAQTSFVLVMLGIAAFMALTLGLIGIYGVVAYAVARRTREVGVRLALGAQQRELRRMFLRHALVLTLAGVGLGLAAAAGLSRVLASLLFQVKSVDPLTYIAVALLLTAATMLASYLPARRASNLSPVAALRAD